MASPYSEILEPDESKKGVRVGKTAELLHIDPARQENVYRCVYTRPLTHGAAGSPLSPRVQTVQETSNDGISKKAILSH